MKTKLLLLFFFSIVFLNARGQTSVYHPFPDSNAVWNYGYQIECQYPCNYENGKFSLFIDGDTLISGISYHKISCPAVLCDQLSCSRSTGYRGAIRQDTFNKKVYYRFPADLAESLLYDFNLNVGDTGHSANISYQVFKIDSVLVGTDYRKRWNINPLVSSIHSQGKIIEGIGSENAFFQFYCHTSASSGASNCDYLNCFKQNGIILYPDTTTSCDIIEEVNNLSNNIHSISISPNPLTTSSTLHFNTQLNNAELIIYNVLGKEMLQKSFSGNEVQMEKGKMESGVYFVKVRAGEKEWVEKLMVE